MKKLVTNWAKKKAVKKAVAIVIIGLLSAVGLNPELAESLSGPISDIISIVIGG
jgi:hypothetical protein